jgi:hypothetical protein
MKTVGIAFSFLLTVSVVSASNDLTGVVVDAGAKPLSGATVYVYTASPRIGVSAFCPSCYRDCGKHAPADGAGGFRLKELDPALRFDLLAVADGYEPSFARHIDPMAGPLTIKLTPRSIADADRLITGIVVDPHGKPVVGAAVVPNGYRIQGRIGYGNIPGIDKLSLTNAKGEFALRIPATDAKLDVLVTARGLAPHIERMLTPGQLSDQSLGQAPGQSPGQARTIPLTEGATITGHVMRDGKPVAGARVGFVQRNRDSSGFLGRSEIGTNDDGLFVMTNLGPNQTYTVYTPMEGLSGGVATPVIVNLGDDKSSIDAGTLVVRPGRRIAGTVVVPEGASIPPHTGITLGSGSDGRSVEVRRDGTFSFDNVPKGDAELAIRISGLKLRPWPPDAYAVAVPPEGDCIDVRVVFERP